MTLVLLLLRGGGGQDPEGGCSSEEQNDQEDPLMAARLQIGRILDDVAPYWTVNKSVEAPDVMIALKPKTCLQASWILISPRCRVSEFLC